MATNFPSSLDTSTTIPAEGASIPLSTNHVTAHQNIQDAIEIIEAKVGADSSAVTTSHDYKLSGVTGSDKAVSKTGSEVLTNKTLTSPVVNVGSDATGDMYYRNAGVLTRIAIGTDNQILKLNGTTPNWEAETVVVAATEAVEGISRLATAAQITAGTASEASYPLVVTPDQLALSTPVFDGSGLTAIPRFLTSGAPGTTVSNTTTTVLTYALAGGILGTNKGVKIKIGTSTANNAVNATFTATLKYGGTTIASWGYSGVSGTPTFTSIHVVDVLLMGSGATGTQQADAMITQGGTTFYPVAGVSINSSSIDSTVSQNITLELTTDNASSTSTFKNYFIEKIV